MEGVAAFLAELRDRLDRAPAGSAGVAVASVVRTRGSTPRKTGAKLLLDPLGGTAGTIGGGCGEAEVVGRARRVLGTGRPELCEVSLIEEDGFESPSVCGGTLEVWIERYGDSVGGIGRDRFFALLDQAHLAGTGMAIVTVIAAGRGEARRRWLGRKTVVDERAVQEARLGDEIIDAQAVDLALESIARARPLGVDLEEHGLRLFAEPLVEPPELVVVGAGHVGAALVAIAARAGFAVTVIDDRPSFANPRRLPDATRILVEEPPRALAALAPRRDRHVVLVTRGHRLDASCLEVALRHDLAYLGMIGSRRRVRRIREWLVERGADPARLDSVHAPIGLDIAAETPAEIAVAILAEVIASRRAPGGAAPGRSRQPVG
jgi:xanthine dehydrogenase accessory factor